MGDLKACLKEAKIAIKDKDYEAALLQCKDALKIDRKNYQALAIFGKVCIELHRYGDSKRALLLATQVDPENPVAWQGLSNLHEKNESCFDKDEEISILSHLVEIINEEEKLDRLHRRLASVYQKYDCIEEAVTTLETLLNILKDGSQIKEVHKSIVDLIESVKEPSDELTAKLLHHYEQLLNDSPLAENEANFKTYLRLLYKTKQFKRLLEGSKKMFYAFTTAYPLEWIARAFVEYNNFSWEHDNDELISEDELLQYIDRLLELYRGSPWGNLAMGLIDSRNGNNLSAKVNLRRGCEALKTNLPAWMALLELQNFSNDHGGTETTCNNIFNIINSSENVKIPEQFADKESLEQYLLLIRVKALVQMGHVNHLKEAVNLLTKVENKTLEIRIMRIKALMKLEMVSEAKSELECLVSEHGEDDINVQKITGFLTFSCGDYEGAKVIYERILEEDTSNAEVLFELGRIHYELRDYQRSLIYLLKAAKYNPKMSEAFLYIGHYYRAQDNLEKARKCYEKALNLNPGNNEAGSSLSDVYRKTGQDEANLDLLLRVTSEGTTGWAWLHLGLHYLGVKNYNEAIKTLQRAVEMNPKNRICLECLGDAYLARGSHTAALKVFTKVSEMHPTDSLYSRCQIARINHFVGLFLLSISQYEEVLAENLPSAVRIVALAGLAEVLLTRARAYKKDQLLSNLKEDCLYAIKCLTRVASENANNLTVWKLLGDACTLQALVPSSVAKFVVPARLLDSSVTDFDQTVEISREEILLLGGRCYGVGLQVNRSSGPLWHDLGVNIFLQGYCKLRLYKESNINPEERRDDHEIISDHIERAITTLKKSIGVDPSNFNAWNSLGVIAYFKGDYPLSQHSFICSLQLHPSVDAWTHLGTLYLSQQEIHLAHEAFSQAQALDPSFVACWVGQAMVATSVGHYEAFDLYRHTTLLGINPESCVGFASNVLKIICDKSSEEDTSKVEEYIPSVIDSLTFYTREKEDDAVAQNMLGITLEMLGLYHKASEALAKAVISSMQNNNLKEDIRDGIMCNFSRVLTSLSKIPESIENYSKIKEPDFYSQCGLALSQFKASQYEEAYQRYAETVEWFTSEKEHKSHIYVALAFLQYKFKNIDGVKDILFQSSSIQGLLALTALGLLLDDPKLTAAALAELDPYVDSKEYVHHIAFLKAMQATLKSNYKEAKLILCRAIHRHPNSSHLWRSLSRHLLTFPEKDASSIRIADVANAAAAASRTLSQASKDNKNIFQDVVLKALAHLKSFVSYSELEKEKGKRKKKGANVKPKVAEVSKETRKNMCLKEAQRAVLMCPSKPETWACLVASMNSKPKACKLAEKWRTEANPQLSSWFRKVTCR